VHPEFHGGEPTQVAPLAGAQARGEIDLGPFITHQSIRTVIHF